MPLNHEPRAETILPTSAHVEHVERSAQICKTCTNMLNETINEETMRDLPLGSLPRKNKPQAETILPTSCQLNDALKLARRS